VTPVNAQTGLASVFSGGHTVDGQHLGRQGWAVARGTLPLGTHVRLTHNGRSIVAQVRDRGPYADPRHRIVDVLPRISAVLALNGLARVILTVIGG
jgi:peptidoglycan lytic transglycosylase